MSRVTLIEAAPWVATTGLAATVRLAGGGQRGYDHLTFTDWKAGVVSEPRFTVALPFSQDGWTGGDAIPQVGTIRFYPSDPAVMAALTAYYWIGAPVTIKTGDDATASPTWTTQITGTIAAVQFSDGVLDLTIADLGAALDVPAVTARFLGTGAAEGGSDALDRIKRRSWGRVFNVEGRILDKVNNIYEFGDPAFKLQSIDEVRDMGRAGGVLSVAWAGSVSATLTALIAATAPPGGAAIAPSIACVKWWTQPAGALTADLHGEIGAGYVETAPAIAAALLAALSTVTITNTAAMVTARPEIAGIHIVDENETVAEALDRLLLGSALVWPLNADGTMTLREISFASPVESLISLDVQRDAAFKPIKSRRLGYRRNELLMSAGDISAILTEPDASGNLIPNPRLELDADGWTVTGATVVNASTGWPAPIGFEFTGTGSARSARQDIVNNGGAFISTQAKRTAAAVMNFNVYWYDAAGGALTTTSEDVTPVASATWEFIDIYIDVPVGAVAFEAELEVASNSGVVDFAGARLGLTEIGGDVTARNAPVMPLPLNVTIEYDSTGTVPQSGQYPALVQFSRQKGGYDVTATTGFSIIATTGNIVATGGTPNASIDNTLGSPTRGLLTVNSPGIGRVTVKTTRPREPDLTQTIELLMHKAAPPTPSTDNTPGDVTSTSDNITSDVLAMQATDTTITCTASLTFRCGSSGSNLNSNVKGKFRRSASSDMSSPTDVGSFVNGSAETAAMEPIFKDPGSPGGDGSLTVTQNDTGRTIGVTYYYQFVEQAISADAYPIHQFGTIQVTA